MSASEQRYCFLVDLFFHTQLLAITNLTTKAISIARAAAGT